MSPHHPAGIQPHGSGHPGISHDCGASRTARHVEAGASGDICRWGAECGSTTLPISKGARRHLSLIKGYDGHATYSQKSPVMRHPWACCRSEADYPMFAPLAAQMPPQLAASNTAMKATCHMAALIVFKFIGYVDHAMLRSRQKCQVLDCVKFPKTYANRAAWEHIDDKMPGISCIRTRRCAYTGSDQAWLSNSASSPLQSTAAKRHHHELRFYICCVLL